MSDRPDVDRALAAFEDHLQRQAEPMARDILQLMSESRASDDQRGDQVRKDIFQRWERGWEYYDAVIYAAKQSAALIAQRSDRMSPKHILDDHAPVRDALCLIHFAACQTLQEIHALLRAGLWGGAAARWRGLHELAVTATLVAMGGVTIAVRYNDHGHVVQTRRLSEYRSVHGRGPIHDDELAKRRETSDLLMLRHKLPNESQSFQGPYGWATPLMPLSKQGKHLRPTFDQLESKAGMADLRLLVASAHGLVHNDSAGVVTAVLGESDGSSVEWIGVPIDRHTETVARPTLLTMQRLQAATLLGFEPELNDFARLLAMQSAGIGTLAMWGARAFERQ